MAKFVSPIRYAGGKSKIADDLVDLFPREFSEYREPFLGGASVFLSLRSQDDLHKIDRPYWLNDKFDPLVWFWWTVQNKKHCVDLMEKLWELFEVTSAHSSYDSIRDCCKSLAESFRADIKDELNRVHYANPDWDDDKFFHTVFWGAYKSFFLNRTTYSGTVLKGGVTKGASEGRWTSSSIDRLLPVSKAFDQVKITCQDFAPVIDSPGDNVFMFLDPPYYEIKGLYTEDDLNHFGLASKLQKTSHKFLMTYNDHPNVRSMYSWAMIEPFVVQYSMDNHGGKECKKAPELLIRNYNE